MRTLSDNINVDRKVEGTQAEKIKGGREKRSVKGGREMER